MERTESNEEIARREWPQRIQNIDRLVERAETKGEWETRPRTALKGDDRWTSPFQTSHAFGLLLSAGIDNLNGVRHLVFGRPGGDPSVVLHQAAHYVLIRGAIENFSTALWILGPNSREERIVRTLRWHVQNVRDQHLALDGTPMAGSRSQKEKIDQFNDLVRRRVGKVPENFGKGFASTAAVRYASNFHGLRPGGRLTTLLAWQLCSAFAHARPWASLGFLEREVSPTDDEDVLFARLTSDLSRVLVLTDPAIQLCATLLRRHEKLNQPLH